MSDLDGLYRELILDHSKHPQHFGLADEDGLPTGIQVLAPALADDRVYRVGAALEAMLTERWGGPLLDRAPVLAGVPA